jgi:hypothetical protein
MLRWFRARLMRDAIRQRSERLLKSPAKLSSYRLVGHATMPDGQRLRVYVDAEAPVTPLTAVLLQAAPGTFDYDGRPLGLQRAPDELSQLVRAHLLGQPATVNRRGATFQAV